MVFGYKCFNKDLTNRYGVQFEVGKIYSVTGEVRFGNQGNGFHMCTNFEDTFRYFDCFNKEVTVCEVKGMGNLCGWNDLYNGYYDMYACENLEIIRIIEREELVDMGLNLNEVRVARFIQGYRLTSKEIQLFKEKFLNYYKVLDTIAYYQEGDKDVHYRRVFSRKKL